jgi:hypothetical protein
METTEPPIAFLEPAVTVQGAKKYFDPPPSDQTIYRLIWAGKIKVLDAPGTMRIPLSELRKFFGRVRVYKRRKSVAKEITK